MESPPGNDGNETTALSRKAVAEALVAEATNIRGLLLKYQSDAGKLKEDVNKFVHRDIDEQAKFSHLRASVLQTELELLHNSQFMEYSSRCQNDESSGARFANAVEKPVASNATTDMSSRCNSECCLWVSVMRKTSAPWLRNWAPDAALRLAAFQRLSDVLRGWKQDIKAAEDDLGRMLEFVDTGANDTEAKYCCFSNGTLCLALHEEDAKWAAALEDGVLRTMDAPTTQVCGGSCPSPLGFAAHRPAEVLSNYYSLLVDAVGLTRREFEKRWKVPLQSELSNRVEDVTIGDRLRLIGDSWDTLTFVRPERLQRTVMVRGFFFDGGLALVEQLGAEVDVIPLFFKDQLNPESNEDRRDAVMKAIQRTFSSLYTAFDAPYDYADGGCNSSSLPANAVLTLAIRIAPAEGGLLSGVLLDVRPLGPTVPFENHVSWIDVCAIGRQRAGASKEMRKANHNDVLESDKKNADNSVLFRFTHLPVASLLPFDAVSRRIFPLLNAKLVDNYFGTGEVRCTSSPDSGAKNPTVSMLVVKTASLSLAAAACVIMMYRFARRSRL